MSVSLIHNLRISPPSGKGSCILGLHLRSPCLVAFPASWRTEDPRESPMQNYMVQCNKNSTMKPLSETLVRDKCIANKAVAQLLCAIKVSKDLARFYRRHCSP